jgi:hypothetical protein
MQHAAGFIIMENIRAAAIRQLDPHFDEAIRQVAIDAINTTVYELMSLIDGVSLGLRNAEYQIDLRMIAQWYRRAEPQDVLLEQLDLREGDGMCMGFHGWMDGDYGDHPVVEP